MRALTEPVHTGVRASRAVDSDVFTTNLPKGALDRVLNGVVMFLTLPAAKRRAIVGYD